MTDDQFLAQLEARANDKKTTFLVTADEMERLQNLGRTFPVPPPKPCIKRGVALAEIVKARIRMKEMV